MTKEKTHKTAPAKTRAKPSRKKKPYFNVLNAGFMKSVKHRWRKPRGVSNKKRVRFAFTGPSPRVGYRNPVALRGLHPSGMAEVRVHNVQDLEGVQNKRVRIAAPVGMRKRKEIEAKAKAMGLKVCNPSKAMPLPKTEAESKHTNKG